MKFPSVKTFWRAVLRFCGRPEVVPADVEKKRGETCDNCPQSTGHQCLKCTCFIPLKIKLATESCPIGNWGEYFNQNHNGLTS